MNRSDRLLLEHHVNQLDQMQRAIVDMRSVLTRRIRRLESDRVVNRDPRQPTLSRVTARERRLEVQLQQHQAEVEAQIQAQNQVIVQQALALAAPPAPPAEVRATIATARDIVREERRALAAEAARARQAPLMTTEEREAQMLPALMTEQEVQAQRAELARLEQERQTLNAYVRPPPRVVTPRRDANKVTVRYSTLKVNQQILTPDVCGICLEQHNAVDILVSNCKHAFGKTCFATWKKTCNNLYHKDVTCPTCREPVTLVTHNRARKARAPRAAQAPAAAPAAESAPPVATRVEPMFEIHPLPLTTALNPLVHVIVID